MRILASIVLTGLVLASVQIAKAETLEVLDQNIQQKSNIEQNNINKTTDNIASYNRNFIAPVYITEVNARLIASYNKVKIASYINLPKGDFVMNASAYTAAADECGKSDGITASGNKVAEGRTIACPKGYEFGTKIQIDGMGTYICEDRGGAIKGNHFDIFMQTKKQAFSFGRKNLLARVIE